ncbi:MAG: hypothetical protein GXP62_04005, partial [Oligoflexia bacterium]|nr:hypothetical protein [Oligoflexia bacterium]
ATDAGATDAGATDAGATGDAGGTADGGTADGGTTLTPENSDDDGDGWTEAEGDCNDGDSSVNPDAPETPYDGIDNDCSDTTPDDDLDGDGYGSDILGGADCDDADAGVSPDAAEVYADGIDNNCDGTIDERFTVQTLETGCDCGNPSAVAVDSDKQVHVVWYNADIGGLQYALDDGSGWSATETIVRHSTGIAGEHIDTVIDAADRLQLGYSFYEDSTARTELDYLYRDSDGTWSDEFVVDDYATSGSEDLGRYVSIDVDDANLPSFAYYDHDNREPRLADILSAPWTLLGIDAFYTNVDENYLYQLGLEDCEIGHWTSLAMDDSGYDNIAYYDDCALAQEAQFTRLDWTLESLAYSETIAADGWYTSLAINGVGDLCTAWYDSSSADLRYGCSEDGGFTWSAETVDSSGAVGEYAALAFDDKGDPWIAYYDATNGDLKVASKSGATWTVWTVDDVGDVGIAPSIAVDVDGVVHITWYDASKGELRYGRSN